MGDWLLSVNWTLGTTYDHLPQATLESAVLEMETKSIKATMGVQIVKLQVF